MLSSPRDPQTRLSLLKPLSEHDQRPASTLVARQFSAVLEASDTFPEGKDCVLADATDGAVVVTLPAGSAEIVGLPFLAYKTDSSANAVSLARTGTDAFADASTSISTTTEGASIGAMWDGTVWRPLSAAATAGPVAATTVAASTSVTVGGSGTGTAAGTVTVNKTAAGTAAFELRAAGVLRAEVLLDGAEKLILRNYAADGTTVLGSMTFDNASGLITSLLGLVITAGGLTVSSGGATLTGGLQVTSGIVDLPLVAYADDAAAGVAGLTNGNLYLIGQTVTAKS